jgi:aspartate/methionine/tyrosine aminotransferase
MSKSFGLPGIRIGWLATQDARMMERFLAAKEQIFICNSVLDKKIAHHFFTRKKYFFSKIQKYIDTNFRVVKSWMGRNDLIEWIAPAGGCTCFPRIDEKVDIQQFYTILNKKYGTFVGPGHWFGMDDRYMRIGYAWPSTQELEGGLKSITRAIDDAQEVG